LPGICPRMAAFGSSAWLLSSSQDLQDGTELTGRLHRHRRIDDRRVTSCIQADA
jgi:hypothetical protein